MHKQQPEDAKITAPSPHHTLVTTSNALLSSPSGLKNWAEKNKTEIKRSYHTPYLAKVRPSRSDTHYSYTVPDEWAYASRRHTILVKAHANKSTHCDWNQLGELHTTETTPCSLHTQHTDCDCR